MGLNRFARQLVVPALAGLLVGCALVSPAAAPPQPAAPSQTAAPVASQPAPTRTAP